MRSNAGAAREELLRRLRQKNEAAAIAVENAAKRRAPVDTGRLRASIAHDSDEEGLVVGTNVEYAVYQELGTRHMDPRPFLVPGLVDSVDELRRIYGDDAG